MSLALYPEARHMLVTDIGRDGMMTGPNIELLARERSSALPRPRRAGVGRRLLARRPANAPADRAAARSSARRCGKQTFGLAEAIDAGR